MRVALIGRTEVLYNTAKLLLAQGYEIALIITAKETPEYKITSKDFEGFSKKEKIPYLYTSNIVSALDFINECGQVDVGVSINYSGIIPSSIIDLFPLGILNAHGGDLPRYRGNACQAWAIINGEEKIGLCIHSMIGDELDSGNIICREYLPIDLNSKIEGVYKWITEQTPKLFLESLKHLETNPNFILEHQSKEKKDILRCYPRNYEDGRIKWNDSAIDILRLINASGKPYPGAFCFYKEHKLTILDAELAPSENFMAVAGQVTLLSENYIEIATSDGKLRLLQIQINGENINPKEIIPSLRCRLN